MSSSCGKSIRNLDKRFVFQAGCAFPVLYGISYWSVPAALITGGLAAIAIAEVRR